MLRCNRVSKTYITIQNTLTKWLSGINSLEQPLVGIIYPDLPMGRKNKQELRIVIRRCMAS